MVPGVPRLPPGKKPPGPPPGPPPPQVLALYGIPARRAFASDTGNLERSPRCCCCIAAEFSVCRSSFIIRHTDLVLPGFEKDFAKDLGRDRDSGSDSDRDRDDVDDDESDSEEDSENERDEGGDGDQRMRSERQVDERSREAERERNERHAGEGFNNTLAYVI